MKSIPNIISAARILLSLMLLFSRPFSPLFWTVYSACGASDILDGYIARKTRSQSKTGAMLDSIGDIVFIGAALAALLPEISISKRILVWIAAIALIRIISLILGYYKYHTFAALHTYANKATGLFLFCFPYLYKFLDAGVSEAAVCVIASLSALEELIIQIASKELSRDIKGLFKIYSR